MKRVIPYVLIVLGCSLMLAGVVYHLSHKAGYKQGQFDARFECAQKKP